MQQTDSPPTIAKSTSNEAFGPVSNRLLAALPASELER
jgi:hypothetical protein